ncbi:heat-shock protein [Methanolobus psychrotolerans]|uniref:heat-shock protein n=1 Tax=Methanolobus psychrotolerans TaxID=1874706 RepID=UPI000B919621|nr:heat-shock protein [Methanolobus psychrotolerans]
MNMVVNTENPFVQALAVSTTMAVFMVGVAIGLMSMAKTGSTPVPMAVMLLVFAVIFIAGSVFFESRGADYMGSLVGGSIVAVSATFSATAFFSGVKYVLDGGTGLEWEQVVSALAVCMIASMFLIRVLQHKFKGAF